MSLPDTPFNAATYQAVIFDMDDTLYPERDFVLSGFTVVATWAERVLGIPADEGYGLLARLFAEGVRGDTFNRWLAAWHVAQPERFLPEMVAVYREHEPQIRPFPEIPSLLQQLRATCRLGLVSDGYLDVQRRKLRALGLAGCFEAIVFSDEWGRAHWKPDPKPYVVVLKKLGILPEQAVYVADNPKKDFLGARRIGMATIRFCFPSGEYAHLEPPSSEHAPDMVTNSLAGLRQLLRGHVDVGEGETAVGNPARPIVK